MINSCLTWFKYAMLYDQNSPPKRFLGKQIVTEHHYGGDIFWKEYNAHYIRCKSVLKLKTHQPIIATNERQH